MAAVFLHVGLPKTGTTSIQAALEGAADELWDHGVLFPGGSCQAQRLAAFDLLGQRVRGANSGAVAGAFSRVVAEIDGHGGDRAIISQEELGLARPRHVRRVVRDLSRHDLYVVVGVRDLGRTLVSAWQQGVLMGDTASWQEFVEGVRDPALGDIRTGASFGLRHDVFRVLDAWGSGVPHDRIRVFTVPPPGSPPGLLLERFAAAADLPATFAGSQPPVRNRSPGPAQIEVVRRLNQDVGGRLNQRQRRFVVERGIRPDPAAEGGSRPLRLPRGDLDWVRERGEAVAAELRERGHTVFGDLDDLLVTEQATSPRRPDDVSEPELMAGYRATVLSLSVALGRRHRVAATPARARRTGSVEVLRSAARAVVLRSQKAALTAARHNRPLAWGVRAYLRRTSTGRDGRRAD